MDAPQPIFTRNGVPINFAFHNSIRNRGAIQALADKIWAHGGEVLDDDEGADMVLINSTRPGADQHLLQSAYDCHPDQDKSKIWVREMSFVDECIQRGCLHLESPPKRPMPGMPPGRARIAFTTEDDENLCKHLARTLPDPTFGGRQSLIFYEKLISLHKYLPDVYSWTKRHTSQSWREHYKKNKARLDLRIAEIVAEEGINPKAFHYKTRLSSPNENLEIEEDDQEEANRLADDEEEAYEANHQDNVHRTPEKGKERAVESEDQLEEENQDADDVRVPKPKTQLQSHTRSERQRTRPSTSTPNSTNEPSQTLINIDPTSQLVRQDEGGGSKVNTPGVSESEDLQPFTLSFEQPMPPAGMRTNTSRASAEPATVEEPIYHNTRSRARSRSASVNPAPAPAPAPAPDPSTKRAERKPKVRKTASSRLLSSLREASHEAEELLPEHEHEHLLPDVQSHSDMQPNPVGGLQEATNVSDLRKRGRELEDEESDDDRQVRDMLENVGENESAPVEVVVETPPRRARGRQMNNSLVAPVPGKPRGRPKKKIPSVASESSSSVVPVDGTRASAHKKKRTEEETYNSHFKPIPGTEAARQAKRMTAA